MLLSAIVCHDIFAMKWYFLCYASMYIWSPNDDFNGKCKYNKGYQSLCLYSFLLSTESWREMRRVLWYHMWFVIPCDCGLWYSYMWCEINAVKRYQSVVPLCFCHQTPMAFLYAFSPPWLTWPSEVAGIIPSVPGAITNK